MRTFLNVLLVLLVAVVGLSSCKDYSEDLEKIGERLSKIERDTVNIVDEVASYDKIVKTLYSHKGITDVVFNSEKNCYVLHFVEGDSLILKNGETGADGKPILADAVGVTKGKDGKVYWTVNGKILEDSNGNPVEVVVPEGNPGEGTDISKMTVPIVRINPVTGKWQLTTYTYFDGQTWKVRPNAPESVWVDLGITSTGSTGPRGPQGNQGEPGKLDYDLFTSVYTYDTDGDGIDDCLVLISKDTGNVYYIKLI